MAKAKSKLYNDDQDFYRLVGVTDAGLNILPFREDYARLIHSASFRRLQGKTQLFPGSETDFFRNRLTHSLEVAQIAKTISHHLNIRESFFTEVGEINSDLIEFAGLAHDLGHPPFGHQGEEALNSLMADSGGYEGNAQTLRILSKLEKRTFLNGDNSYSYHKHFDNRGGLNLTMRSLAAILKYNEKIPEKISKKKIKVHKGYYFYDEKLVRTIIDKVAGKKGYDDSFKTIECYIMDIADDIAYSTFDLEDTLKANFLNPLDILSANDVIISKVADRVTRNMTKEGYSEHYSNSKIRELIAKFLRIPQNIPLTETLENNGANLLGYLASVIYSQLKEIADDGYMRSAFSSKMAQKFISGIVLEKNEKIPALSKVRLSKEIREEVEVVKNIIYVSQIESPRLKVPEYRGKDIINSIFDSLIDTKREGYKLMPSDFLNMYNATDDKKYKKRIICDFIAGMTNRYAIEFYGRLKSENPQSIFKPL